MLDLHCDSVAVMHLYTHTGAAGVFRGLADHLDARAVLLAGCRAATPMTNPCRAAGSAGRPPPAASAPGR